MISTNVKIFVKILTIIVLVFGIGNAEVTTSDSLNVCCTAGENWAAENKICTDYKGPVDNIPIGLQGICLSTLEICCSRYHRYEQCKLGQNSARNGDECITDNTFGTEFFKDCCESCKIGLIMGSSGEKCSLLPFEFGSPWDESFETCCNELGAGGTFVLKEGEDMDLCNKFQNLCDHICVNTDNSYVCKCHPNFVLWEDNISCVPELDTPIDEFKDENEITKKEDTHDDIRNSCENGYEKNPINGECIDINECETDEPKCDMNTEICYNQPGSYMCIQIASPTSDCDEGYRFNIKLEKCDDINECMEEMDNCNHKTQICLNTRGSFQCQNKVVESCLPGFKYDLTLHNCQDVNECLNDMICETGKKCVNTPGSFECIWDVNQVQPKTTTLQPPFDKRRVSCAPGFTRLLENCVDVNECLVDKSACDSNQNCFNFPGGYKCECKIGFALDPLTNACVDVNECQINNHECLESQRCDNTIGSYNCIRLQGCGTGYTLNAATGQCEDDDECILNTHNCLQPYECRNTIGSFRCVPPPRTTSTTTTTTTTTTPQPPPTTQLIPLITNPRIIYRPTHPTVPYITTSDRNENYNRYYGPCNVGLERNEQGACADINECEQGNVCRRNQRCINTNGSYKCESLLRCSGGFTSNDEGTQCIDIDECETREANCGPDQLCRNKAGGYICYCPPGHILNKDNRCEDIDECVYYRSSVCPGNSECVNTVGSYRCECNEGFTKSLTEDKTCLDVDECTTQGLCEQKCINYWGSYRCACDSGYKLSYNNRSCDDLDECEIHKSYDLCMGVCENIPGSYSCTCPQGYRLGADSRTCQDIDECETQNVCRGRNEICTNTRGSYKCTRITCPHEYRQDPERKNRCTRISLMCDQDDYECLKKPSVYSYNFITIVSKMSIPPAGRGLFNYKGPNWFENIDFDLRVIDVSAPSHIEKANEHFFGMTKIHNEVLLSLMRSIEGPQEIELDLTMTIYRNRQLSGSNVAKIFIIISEYPY